MTRVRLYFALTALTFLISMTSTGVNRRVDAGGLDEAAARAAARNPEAVLVQIPVGRTIDRERATSLGTLVADYGSSVVVAANPASLESARRPGGSAASLDVSILSTGISLRGFQFDPLRDDPARALAGGGGYKAAGDASGDYYLVQFVAPVTDGWLRAIREAGGEVIQYVPHQAFVVSATPQAIDSIEQLPMVRWAGVFQPAYKLSPDLMWSVGGVTKDPVDGSTHGFGRAGAATYDIAVFRTGSLAAVASEVTKGQGTVLNEIRLPNNYFNIVRARLQPQQLRAIIALRDVVSIDPYIPPTREDERAAQVVAGNYTGTTTLNAPGYNPLAQFGVDGTNVTVSVVDDGVGIPGDGGFYVTASNTVNGPLRGATAGAQGHGHLNASIIAGDTPFGALDPTGYNYGRGVAPKAHIVNIPLLRSGYTGSEADTCNDTIGTSGPNSVPGYISNNSWGNGTNGNAYDSLAAQYDGFVRDSSFVASIDPLVIVFSAGNQGASGLTRPKVAKNLISVAASENVRTELSPAADHDSLQDIADFSSRGLAADGRVKPDLSAPGAGVTGGRSGTDALFGNIDAHHRWSEGTSHAAPNVAGAAALFVNFWKNGHGGVNPSPALVKAALINSTTDMTGAFASAARPNGFEGWGLVNLKNILNTGTATEFVDQTVQLSAPGQVSTMTGTVSDGSKPFNVTLVWTDPPAASDPALVNNLDLEVTVGGQTYKGNVLAAGVSTTGGTFDTKNNIENVFVMSGLTTGGTFSVKVTATALNGDGILGNGDVTDQHFALMVQNAVAAPAAVVNSSSQAIIGESCAPGNGVIDPGETVTVDLSLQNVGTAPASNLVATLLATGGVTAPSGPETYGMLVSGGGLGTRPFTFTANGTCGNTVTATLQLQDGATDLGTATFTFQLGALGAAQTSTYSSGAVSVPIPVTGTVGDMVEQVIAVSDTGAVQDVNVRIRLNHTYDGDISISLAAPDGTVVPLASGRGGSGDNYGSGSTDCAGTPTVFDDAAGTPISGGTAPFVGTFRPDAMLSAFNGKSVNGNWRLRISDGASGDSGTLFCWSLEITRAAYACCGSPAAVDDTIGIYDSGSGTFFLRNSNTSGAADVVASFGPAGVTPLAGDWDGNGTDTVGIYVPASGAFFLRNSNTPGGADVVFTYGPGGASLKPVVGDWDGNGSVTAGLYDPATGAFFLKNSNANGAADIVFTYGAGGLGLLPVIGDWNNDGIDTVGLYDPATGAFFLKNTNAGGAADAVFSFGAGGLGYLPIAGDWNNDGADGIGLYQPGSGAFFLKNALGGGGADFAFFFGGGGQIPLAGDWNG